MRATYRQIADKFGDEDGLPSDPNLTNQYYEVYNDFEKKMIIVQHVKNVRENFKIKYVVVLMDRKFHKKANDQCLHPNIQQSIQ